MMASNILPEFTQKSCVMIIGMDTLCAWMTLAGAIIMAIDVVMWTLNDCNP